MRIGVLTFHHVPNYGAVLQAYALCKTLAEMGHRPEIIDYRPERALRYYRPQLNPLRKRRPYVRTRAFGRILKAWRIGRFLNAYLPQSQRRLHRREDLKVYSRYYDLVIAGSDQIWDVESFRGFDPSFFLDFVCPRTTLRAVYGASFGKTGRLKQHQATIRDLIRSLDAVSVRDSNSQDMVRDVADRQAPVVLDPTFLATYDGLSVRPSIQEPYLLIYGNERLGRSQEAHVRSIAQERGLRIVSVGYESPLATTNDVGAGPREWLGYLQRASYVVTSFYHGLIFSVLHERPFTVFVKNRKANKMGDLLARLDLRDRSELSARPDEVDYAAVARRVACEVERSRAFLRGIVDGDR